MGFDFVLLMIGLQEVEGVDFKEMGIPRYLKEFQLMFPGKLRILVMDCISI
jgi:hypothetical protein